MSDSLKDLVLALILFAVGLGAFLYIQYGPGVALQNSRDAAITYRSFPSVVSGLLMLLSAVFAMASARAWLRARARDKPEAAAPEGADDAQPAGLSHLGLRVVALLVLLIAFANALGMAPLFVLASVFLFVSFFVFGQRRPVRMGVVALLGGACFHGLFVTVLNLPLS